MAEQLRDESWSDRLRAARAELEAAVGEIRGIPGNARFLESATFDDVASGSPRPLVYLAPTFVGGVALVVQGDDVTALELPDLTEPAVAAAAGELATSYARRRADPGSMTTAWRDCLDRTGRWLWDVAVAPLEDALRTDGVDLVPCGPLGLLPVHAAWRPDEATPSGRRYLVDVTAVSYAPSARMLRSADDVRVTTQRRRLLAVVDPVPTTGAPLPLARREVEAAVRAFRGGEVLDRERAAAAGFVERVTDADLLHFAGHGYSDVASPMDSALVFADDRALRLQDIVDLPLRLRLAVLSACETAVPGHALPDEVVALPTGLLQAGAAGVLATQWAVQDGAAAMLVADFYRRWTPGVTPGAALRDAQRWLRDSTNDEKASTFAASDGWLDPTTAAALYDLVAWAEPDRRDHASVDLWAAFAHYGT